MPPKLKQRQIWADGGARKAPNGKNLSYRDMAALQKMSFEDWQVQLAVHLAKILRVFGKNLPRFTIVSLVL